MREWDQQVVDAFGLEWERFDQSRLNVRECRAMFDGYFAIFPWERLGPEAAGCDVGCGTGRWAQLVAGRVGTLHCVDPSAALEVAQRNLAGQGNCIFHRAHAGAIPVPDGSLDFGYSLGVLHHVPDPAAALAACVRKLKPGAPFLLYLYYALDNRPAWFRGIWRAADMVRLGVARLPARLRFAVCDGIAAAVYWPLSRLSAALEWTGLRVDGLPLAQYRRRSFYTLRTDALDRFGTRLERRFRREEIADMMEKAELGDIHFSEREPFWCAVGIKAGDTGGRH